MYNISSEYLEAIENGEIQHIQGRISPKYGTPFYIDDENMAGEVSYSRQCTSCESEFGIGQLYTGTATVTLRADKANCEYLRDGTLYLNWCVSGFDWIPLGEWTITDTQRTAENFVTITAHDCINRLDVAINDSTVGAITLEARIAKVQELTGIEFAQTTEEIKNMIGDTGIIFGSTFCPTCRAEIAAIAEYMGGFAVADRQNRLEFRKIGQIPVLEIPADLRYRINLKEYTYGIRGVAFTDKNNHTTIREVEGTAVDVAGIPTITNNPYIWEANYGMDDEKIDIQYRNALEYASVNLRSPSWTPGEIEYYGNPALDLGDFVEISGGINGEKSTLFLITAEHWQFRGTHTLISAGASESTVNSVNGNISGNQQIIATINTTKNINAVDLESTGETEGKILSKFFSVREETTVFADITLNLRGKIKGEIKVTLNIDNVEQNAFFVGKITENEAITAHFSAHRLVSTGSHSVSVNLSETCEILGYSAYIWGQNIVGDTSETASSGAWSVTVRRENVVDAVTQANPASDSIIAHVDEIDFEI